MIDVPADGAVVLHPPTGSAAVIRPPGLLTELGGTTSPSQSHPATGRGLRAEREVVHVPERPKVPLYLVVIEGPWLQPILLLTTEKPGRSRRSVWRLVEGYFARWRVEESIRFVKQSYRLADIRLLRYARLHAMVTLVVAVAYFAAVYLGRRPRLRLLTQHILRSAKRIYGVPEFRFYAVPDGTKQLLVNSLRGLGPPLLRSGDQFSLLLSGD